MLGDVLDEYTYNTFGEVESYKSTYGSKVLFKTIYEHDSLGRITTINETTDDEVHTLKYKYDIAGRLKEVQRNDKMISSYSYDPNGNRIQYSDTLATIGAAYDLQDRLLTYGGNHYFYSADGDLTMKISGSDTTRYEYDALGNLIKVLLPNRDLIEYTIDAHNRRIGKKLNGRFIQKFIYSSQYEIIAELDSLNQVVTRFSAGFFIKAGVAYRVITDHLGSIRLIVNASTGAIVQKIIYDEFGNVLHDSNPGFQPFGFARGLYDAHTRLVHLGSRDLDPETGRWTCKDPINFAGGLNFYVYGANDPINHIDFNGKDVIDMVLGTFVHQVVLKTIRARLGFRNVPVKPIRGGGRPGGYGYPDLLVAGGPTGTEIYELKSMASYQTAYAQLERYMAAAACQGIYLTPGTSLSGDTYVLSNIPVIEGYIEIGLYYMGPGVIGYQFEIKGPSISKEKILEATKNASYAMVLLLMALLAFLFGNSPAGNR
jgi:RHS repeat-associated protein